MPAVPTLRSINDVMNWYNDQDNTSWEMYRFKPSANYRQALYHGKDKDEAARRLLDELNRIHHDDCENYYLALGDTKGVKDKKFEQVVGMYFVVNEKPSHMVGAMPPYYMQRGNHDNEILNEIRALRAERLAEMQDDADEEEEQPATASSILAGMLQQPQVQQMLITILGNIAGNFMKPNVQHISGTHTAEDLQKIIDTLFAKGVTPDDLAKLAEMPQSQISMLLSMLRK
jgi:transcription initiation factor IIE alpha subunit